ncbi:HAMP domain-containing protein [Dactylosporangium sp. NPDC000555]|uniref:HAMP domain-containing protein n=1 Tax=Dactylosporangium sp. NPDC000555 TaxID=3154260 RepID=UPI00332FA19C
MRGGLIPRFIISCVVLIFVFGAAFSTLLVAILQHRETDRTSARSVEILAAEAEAEQQILDLDRTARGFIVTRDPVLLGRWHRKEAELDHTYARLQRLAHTPDQARQAQEITRDGHSYIRDHATPMLQAAQRGDPAAHSIATLQQDERRIVELEAELDRLASTEARFAADRDQRAQATVRLAVAAVVGGMASAFLLGSVVVGYTAQVIVRPIRRAAAMAGHLARGDLDKRVPETGAGEVGDLARSFNMMGDAVQRRVRTLLRTARKQAAVRRIATRVARGAAPAAVLDAAAADLRRLIGSDGAHAVRYETDGTATFVGAWRSDGIGIPIGTRLPLDGHSVTATVLRTGRPARMDSYADALGAIAACLRRHHIRGAVGAPILVEGRLWGAVNATVTDGRSLAPDAEARLAEFADLIAAAIANTRARRDLAASRLRVVVAADQARRQIERDLHHGIQQLIAITIQAGGAVSSVPPEMRELRRSLSALPDGLNGVLDDLREISRGIHPTMLSDRGLGPALKALARRSAVPVELDAHVDDRLPEPIEMAAYHIAAEALTNTARHARASYARLELTVHDGRLQVAVHDDGVGGADPARGAGLLGLTDRVEALKGSITVSSPPGRGTTLRAELPLEPPAELSHGSSTTAGTRADWCVS